MSIMTTDTDQREVVLDFESRSTLQLGRGGTNAYKYARHPTTAPWFARYAFTDAPDTVHTWWPHESMPGDLFDHVLGGGLVSVHNAGFEHAMWNYCLTPRYGWLPLPLEQMDDTAARAARCGLPRALEKAAPAAGIPIAKDMAGNRLMKQMAKPRKVEADGSIIWWDVPEKLERLHDYGGQDVLVQMQLHLTLPRLPPSEWEIWQATMRANERGCVLDQAFIDTAQRAVQMKLAQYAEELLHLTNGQVKSHTDLNGMKAWLGTQGIHTDSLDKNVVAELRGADVPAPVKRVLTIRSEAGKSSVAKYPAMEMHAEEDGAARDQMVYYGATATGRWSAQGFQLHNLPARGPVKYYEAEAYIDLLLKERDTGAAAGLIETVSGHSIIETLSMCLRGTIRARPGKVLVSADFANIEGRKNAWFGGENWKLYAFRQYDAGTGPDLYRVTAGQILGRGPDDVTDDERQVLGKVPELALGFGGGVGAFVDMGRVYGVHMDDYADVVRATLPEYWEKAKENFEAFGNTNRCSYTAWLASEAIKLAWRERHPGIVQSWRDAEDAAVAAIRTPGQPYYICDGKLGMLARHMFGKLFLLLRLPSGRCIHYANVRLKDQEMPWGGTKPQIRFDKVEQGRVLRAHTYGGDLIQSAVQGTARDLMAHGWLQVAKAGYEVLFSVHDELVAECPAERADLSEFERLMCDLPEWAAGCPVTASGYVSQRFRKD